MLRNHEITLKLRPGVYNEVIVDINDWEQRLPRGIEAVVFTGEGIEGPRGARQVVQMLHDEFARLVVPVVKYDPTNLASPFTEIPLP
eukprot:6211371-Pleurochrysis_carterae.AAC.1